MSKWIKADDTVLVISGNDKGKSGKVLQRKKDRVVVQGINIRKKHVKRTQQAQTAQIIDIEVPIHISNVALCDEKEKKIKLKVKVTDKSRELIYIDQDKETVFRSLKKGK